MPLEILSWDETPLGILCLRRRELASRPGTIVTEVTLDHEFLMSSYHTVSEEAMASEALERVDGDGLRVLVGGLGLGYTAQAALRCERVIEVRVIELLPQVIAWLEDDQVPLAGELRDDARLSVQQADVYAELTSPGQECWDAILVDVDHSPDERLSGGMATFYSKEGLRSAQTHLKPGGVLAVWSAADSEAFLGELQGVFDEAWHREITFHNDLVDLEQTDHLFLAKRPAHSE
ncbi:MAG: spermidine synthase [Planctomycetota bacterium]